MDRIILEKRLATLERVVSTHVGKRVTLWYRLFGDKRVFNHVEHGHAFRIPQPQSEAQRRAWKGAIWEGEYHRMDSNNRIIRTEELK